MDDLKAALRGGDPVARGSGLSAADAAAIRRAVIAAADAQERMVAPWPRPIFLAATLAAAVIVGLAAGMGRPWSGRTPARLHSMASQAASASSVAERRQLQFATPGGTRIIWVFDTEFNP